MDAVINRSKEPPEQPYVVLMLRVFAQARQQNYADSGLLRVAVWLIYRVFDINPRQPQAYALLSYSFCLLGEWERARLILEHGLRGQENEALNRMQALLHKAVKNERESTDAVRIPSLSETLEQVQTASVNLSQARPELNALAALFFGDREGD